MIGVKNKDGSVINDTNYEVQHMLRYEEREPDIIWQEYLQ